METMSGYWSRVSLATALLGTAGFAVNACSASGSGQEQELLTSEQAILGDALPGTDLAVFAAAKDNFRATEIVSDGLGPIFNANACSTCHANSAPGGAGEQVEARYGTISNGVFNGLGATGGTMLGGTTGELGFRGNEGSWGVGKSGSIRRRSTDSFVMAW